MLCEALKVNRKVSAIMMVSGNIRDGGCIALSEVLKVNNVIATLQLAYH